MSALLVSFCNTTGPAAARLAVYDIAGERLRDLALSDMPATIGTTGLATDGERIYVASQVARWPGSARSFLFTLARKDLSLLSTYTFRHARDVHSICWRAGALLAVSSGTDEIVRLDLARGVVVSEAVHWRADPNDRKREDSLHLNGICLAPDGLIVCGFGKKAGKHWSSATSGFLYNADRRHTIAAEVEQPHSVTSDGEALFFCESRKMAVRAHRGASLRVQQELPGYTRGICRAGASLFVATSTGRRTSGDATLENPAESGVPHGECTISRLDPTSLAPKSIVSFGVGALEIYDLLPADDVALWPMARERRGTSLVREPSVQE